MEEIIENRKVYRKRTYVPDAVLQGVGIKAEGGWSGNLIWVKRVEGSVVEFVVRSPTAPTSPASLAPTPGTAYIRQPGITPT